MRTVAVTARRNPVNRTHVRRSKALIGKDFKVSSQRGIFIESPLAPFMMATVHPSSLLRAPDDETRRLEMIRFIEDLQRVHEALEKEKAA